MQNIIFNTVISEEYLPKNILSDEFKKNKLVIIKSDTGTGKTTIITEFLKLNPGLNFLSIASRVTLSIEHHRIFNNKKIKSQHYKNEFLDDDKGLCVQLESIYKIFNTYNQEKISNSILILDEIKSFIQHLITSPTVKDKKQTMMKFFFNQSVV